MCKNAGCEKNLLVPLVNRMKRLLILSVLIITTAGIASAFWQIATKRSKVEKLVTSFGYGIKESSIAQPTDWEIYIVSTDVSMFEPKMKRLARQLEGALKRQ